MIAQTARSTDKSLPATCLTTSMSLRQRPQPVPSFRGLGSINRYEDTAHSNYNAVQSRCGATSATSAAAWHTPTATRSTMLRTAAATRSCRNSYDTHVSYASSNFDQRHLLEISAVYDLPSPFHNAIAKETIDGWQISDLTSFQTARPSR